eukprot:CAMPEP_0184398728 /NCGR_PEP_ID=MMETSP0007-20130409/67114_1 /TAXON_ID=97485 /ORGANISM="Prymnesium parvum, Strain Texoma1" /LENGTH=49 /DNA_ID= /DNA_START= /DNA_END= /DNA_ORIENTATION=
MSVLFRLQVRLGDIPDVLLHIDQRLEHCVCDHALGVDRVEENLRREHLG